MLKIPKTLLLTAFILLAAHGMSYGFLAHLTTFENTYPYVKGKAIDSCLLCHTSATGGASWNQFGKDYGKLTGAHAITGHVMDTFDTALMSYDSDGDLFSNIKEVKDLTFPGNALSKPQKPVVTAFTLAASTTLDTATITKLTATSPSGATLWYKVTETSTKPLASATGWTRTKPTSYTFTTSGAKTLYAWAKDRAGLVSAGKSATVTVKVPVAAAPATTAVTSASVQSQTSATASSTTGRMPLPSGAQIFSYATTATPVRSDDPSAAKPVGVGTVATGGKTLDLQVSAGFGSAVDVYLTLYVPAEKPTFAPVEVYVLQPNNTFKALSAGGSVVPWRTNTTGINTQVTGSLPVDTLPAGQYVLILTVVPSGTEEGGYYEWITNFIVP